MSTELSDLIRKLSEIYDADSKDTFVTVYLSKKTGEKYINQRENSCLKLLDKDEQQNFESTLEMVKKALKQSTSHYLAIFASSKHHLLEVYPLPIELHDSFVVDSSPYIRPLARIQDEFESYTLVLVNTHQAKIYSVSLGEFTQEKRLSKDIMNKHKKGGWSQPRFQRLRKGAIHEFFTEVVEYLEKHADNHLVLAGPGTAKKQFFDMLPQHLQKKVIDTLDVDIDDEQELFEMSSDAMEDYETKQGVQAVDRLKQEILKDGLAVYGLEETLQAAQNGQVDTLIIQKDYKLKGCLCEHCQLVKAGPIKDCPLCGGPTTEADVVEEIIEFALRTNAQIEFTDAEALHELGHIGALLRFKL